MGIVLEARGRIDRPRTTAEDTVVEIRIYDSSERPRGKWRRLDPAPSLRLRNHSPTGFSWGYAGSGPSQLALAILLEATDRAFAEDNYMAFKFETIARLPFGEPFELRVDVERWKAATRRQVSGTNPDSPISGVTMRRPERVS